MDSISDEITLHRQFTTKEYKIVLHSDKAKMLDGVIQYELFRKHQGSDHFRCIYRGPFKPILFTKGFIVISEESDEYIFTNYSTLYQHISLGKSKTTIVIERED